MRGTKKRSFMLVITMNIIFGVVAIAGVVACQATPETTNKVSSSNTSRVVKINASLAHTYTSLKELKRDSILIVQGTVSRQTTSIGNHGIPWTTSTLSVERTLVGKLPQAVLVRQTGGVTSDGTRWEVEDFPLLQIGSHYILFLTASPIPTELYPVGAPQGVFVVDKNNNVSSLNEEGLPVESIPLNTFVQEVLSA